MRSEILHPARQYSFDDLAAGLHAAEADGMVKVSSDGDLRLFCYTKQCAYERAWTPFTMVARGLIVDVKRREVVATPFPKFFNIGENGHSVPAEHFDAYEKVDGSLIVVFYHDGRWRAATKGSFFSDQAAWAQTHLDDLSAAQEASLDPGTTYLLEAVYAANRIVVPYPEDGLVILGGYDADGRELEWDDLEHLGGIMEWRCARRVSYRSIAELVAATAALPPTEEGFVIRFSGGLRLKAKGAEYCRIHALISRCTPLAVHGMIVAGDDLDVVRRDLPEEFHADFDAIVHALEGEFNHMAADIQAAAAKYDALTDRELGLALHEVPETVRRFIFPVRKGSADKLASLIWREIRPTGNRLPGYVPRRGGQRAAGGCGMTDGTGTTETIKTAVKPARYDVFRNSDGDVGGWYSYAEGSGCYLGGELFRTRAEAVADGKRRVRVAS